MNNELTATAKLIARIAADTAYATERSAKLKTAIDALCDLEFGARALYGKGDAVEMGEAMRATRRLLEAERSATQMAIAEMPYTAIAALSAE